MLTIALIGPYSAARCELAALLRSEFRVLENASLTRALTAYDTRAVVAAAEAVSPAVLAEPPFAGLPFLIIGHMGPVTGRRTAPVLTIEGGGSASDLAGHLHALIRYGEADSNELVERAAIARSPFLPVTLITQLDRLARAHVARLPVLITGERGTGKRTAARYVAEAAGHGSVLHLTPLTAPGLVDGSVWQASTFTTRPVTIIADGIEKFRFDVQVLLADSLAAGKIDCAGASRPLWLVATTSADIIAAALRGRFDAELAARLGEVVCEIPPLRARPGDILPIAEVVLSDIGTKSGSVRKLTRAACARLERHLWPGNLTELLAVMRRTALLRADETIGADGLVFAAGQEPSDERPTRAGEIESAGFERPPRQAALHKGASVGVSRSEASPPAPPRLEFVLTELAHELKNPMVTIKTFAENLPALLEDVALRERFTQLTNDAITRMDGLLENVLDFARFEAPRPAAVPLTSLLDDILASVTDTIERRGAHVRREGWDRPACIEADQGQLRYALRNLFDALASELPRDHELGVRIADDGTIALRFLGTGGITGKLRGLLNNDVGMAATAALPLRFMLARAVIARNGGELAVASGDDETVVTVTLPPARRTAGLTAAPGGAVSSDK